MVRRRWWVGGLLVAWALVLLVAAVWSAHHGPDTVRGQSDLATGRQTLDRAVTTVVEVAGAGVAAEIQPYQVTHECRLTVSRPGTELDRTVVLTVPPGEESRLLERLAGGLPEQWGARYHPDTNRFVADAGEFVAVRGEVVEAGRVQLTVATGCRPGSDPDLASRSQ